MKTIRVLYMVNALPMWVDVADRLCSEQGWFPVYWVTDEQIEASIQARFPGVICDDIYSSSKGIYHPKYKKFKQSLDKELLIRFSSHESIALSMLDRQDMYKCMTDQERKRIYYSMLRYWLFVLKDLKVDVIVFSDSPHFISAYVCYAVALHLGVKTIMTAGASIPNLMYPKCHIEDVPHMRLVSDKDAKHHQSNVSEISEYIRKNSLSYDVAEPWYMKEGKDKPGSVWKVLLNRVNSVFRIRGNQDMLSGLKRLYLKLAKLNEENTRSYWKKQGSTLADSRMSNLDLYLMFQGSYQYINGLRKAYDKLAENVSLECKYLYFPLHFQPERTSIPEGDIYSDQWLVINMLSATLPEGWFLYVKEHPLQFKLPKGAMGRLQDYYEQIKQFPNVKLIKSEVGSFTLIDKATGVVTLRGTAGLEAVIRGVPAIVFGYAWYRNCPGIFYCTQESELKSALDKISRGYAVQVSDVNTYLLSLDHYLLKGSLYPTTRVSFDTTHEELVDNMCRLILTAHRHFVSSPVVETP